MSAFYPGADTLPAVPPPWRPWELRAPDRVTTSRPSARAFVFVALCVAVCWFFRDVMLLWFVAPVMFPGCWWW
jgi:hypothetical protein